MSLKPEGCACWAERCLECNTMNYGCIRFDVKCANCGARLKLPYYPDDKTTEFIKILSKPQPEYNI